MSTGMAYAMNGASPFSGNGVEKGQLQCGTSLASHPTKTWSRPLSLLSPSATKKSGKTCPNRSSPSFHQSKNGDQPDREPMNINMLRDWQRIKNALIP